MNLDNFFEGFCTVALAVLMVFGLWCIEGLIFMLLWNWVAVGLFSAPVLTFWQSFGLCLLLSVIGRFFKSTSSK